MFHFLHASPPGCSGWNGPPVGLLGSGLTITSSADSKCRKRSDMPGSGELLWAHSCSVWLVAKHTPHLQVPTFVAEKFIAYSVHFILDHCLFPVKAACLRNAVSYHTQPRHSPGWPAQSVEVRHQLRDHLRLGWGQHCHQGAEALHSGEDVGHLSSLSCSMVLLPPRPSGEPRILAAAPPSPQTPIA